MTLTLISLVVKVYENGQITQYFSAIKCGDVIDDKQYYGGISNYEIGKFHFGDPSHYEIKHWSLSMQSILIIGGGTGLAPMIQILQSVHSNYLNGLDHTKIQ